MAKQLDQVVHEQIASSNPLTEAWIREYASLRDEFSQKLLIKPRDPGTYRSAPTIQPNEMQRDALKALQDIRAKGAKKSIIISATGTGKTMLSALDVRSVDPDRLLFIVHREQIIDRTILEYERVLGGPSSDYGKLTGTRKDFDSKYLFATIQTLSQDSVLSQMADDDFDDIIFDEDQAESVQANRLEWSVSKDSQDVCAVYETKKGEIKIRFTDEGKCTVTWRDAEDGDEGKYTFVADE